MLVSRGTGTKYQKSGLWVLTVQLINGYETGVELYTYSNIFFGKKYRKVLE